MTFFLSQIEDVIHRKMLLKLQGKKIRKPDYLLNEVCKNKRVHANGESHMQGGGSDQTEMLRVKASTRALVP